MRKTGVKQKSDAIFLIFLVWLVYAVSYFGKVNYSANISRIIDFYGISKAEAGVAPTLFFFSYGIGQVVNGILCKRYNIKWTIFISLVSSAVVNLGVALCSDFSLVKWLWLVNGFVLSMLWPTLIRLLAEAMPEKMLGKSSMVIGTTVATGTLLIYALSSLYATFGSFRLAFYTASFSVFAVSTVWLLSYNKAVWLSKKEKANDEVETKEEIKTESDGNKKQNKMFFVVFGILCFYAIGVNLTKDGLTTWVPSILKETFEMSDSISILLTLALPVIAIFGNAWSLRIHKKVPDYIGHCALVFSACLICVGLIIGFLSLKLAFLMLIGLAFVNFLVSSLNSLITSIFPLFMREMGNSGFYAGILNGFSYLGSALSSYGLGFIADHFGWYGVFFTLIIFCVVFLMVFSVYFIIKRISKSTL